MAWLETNGARIHYDTAGEDGTPVLLVMGFAAPGRVWSHQVPPLSARHRVAWFDNRGSGATHARPGLYSMDLFARDALALMDRLGWDDAHVVGASMGGMIAQHLALAARARVRSLSLIATHADIVGGTPTLRGLRLFAESHLRPSRRVELLARLLFPEDYLAERSRDELLDSLRRDFHPSPPLASRLSQLAAIARHRTARRLRELEGLPTVVLEPARDLLIPPRACARVHAAIPGARRVVFPDAGHGLTGQCADRVSRVLLDHFEDADRLLERAARRSAS